MSRSSQIDAQARLIAALAETMTGSLWGDEILQRCKQIEDAVAVIRSEAQQKKWGES